MINFQITVSTLEKYKFLNKSNDRKLFLHHAAKYRGTLTLLTV